MPQVKEELMQETNGEVRGIMCGAVAAVTLSAILDDGDVPF